MANENPPTAREFTALTEALKQSTDSVENLRQFLQQNYVTKEIYELELKVLKDDVQSHEDWIKWGTRLLLGIMATTVFSLVVTTAVQLGALK